MTLLSELIEIPTEVHRSDFVISLASAVHDPEGTLRDYVITPQLADCFDRALSLVASAVTDQRSKAAFLHASFGAGKTAMMAVLDLLLAGEPAARSLPELAPVVGKYAPRLDGRKFLLVPYHFIGMSSMEQAVLGGYVEHVKRLHPDAPLPPVYVSDGIVVDAHQKRQELGDEVFFRILSEGEAADEWGAYGTEWDAVRFEAAAAAPPGSSDHDLLVGALLRTHYRALPGQAQATAEGFVPLEAGLEAMSRHAKGLGYDAVVLFLDELVLWLEARMSEPGFLSREGNKIVKLVEADHSKRPAPIVSFVARQRDLKELVGDDLLGPEAVSAFDVLQHTTGRFDPIMLEDRNLSAIAEKRLLRPRTEQARQLIDDAFDRLRKELDERQERDVLLTDTGDLDAFRRLYPFSPALVDALVALSGVMQRSRTALRAMLQLLVDSRDRLELGQLVPLGDLWDVVAAGEDPLTEVMRAQFLQARRLWSQKFEPMLLQGHGLSPDDLPGLDVTHPFVTDARLVKSLLITALVPNVAPLRGLTVSRLTALNSGVVRAFIPGTERQQVLDKLRRWASDVGELRLGEDEQDPTVAVVLSGIDTGPILEAARMVDSDGERKRRVKGLLVDALQVKDPSSQEPWAEVTWRGTRRRIDVLFANVRDEAELPDEYLRAGHHTKLVIDYPWDLEAHGPVDDRARVRGFRQDHAPEWTAVWLPNFLTEASRKQLGQLVRLEYILTGDTFDKLAAHLPPTDRPVARTQLANQRSAVHERVVATLRQAYGVDPQQEGAVEDTLPLGDQFQSCDDGLNLQPPVGTSLRTHLEGLADQLLRYRFPKHPDLTEQVSRAELNHTLHQVSLALQQPGGRLENVETPMRKVLTKVAGPLRLGTMYQAHFVADLSWWVDLVERRRAGAGAVSLTVGQVRAWLDGADQPAERRGLTRDVADLVLLLVAAATNRVLTAAGQPVAQPEIGKLRDDWELRAQDLPSPEVWTTALERAEHMGVVPISRLLSANTVADFGQRLDRDLVADNVQAARDLIPRVEAAYARFGIESGRRLDTAKAAVALLDGLRRHPDAPADAVAACEVPTTATALGTSIKQAAPVVAELERTNWDLLRHATSLGSPWATDAEALRSRLVEALMNDEHAIGLVARLRQATHAATDLLARATRAPSPPPVGPDPAPGTGVAPTPVVDADPPMPPTDPEPSFGFDRATAERRLEEIRQRLLAEAGLDLSWQIVEVGDGGRDAAG